MPAIPRVGMDQDHYDWSPLPFRPRLTWPDGQRVALCVVVALDCAEVDPPNDPLFAKMAQPPEGTPYPDLNDYLTFQYGLRTGLFRVMKVLDKYEIPVTVAMDATVADNYSFVVQQCQARGWEFIGRGLLVSSHCETRSLFGRHLGTTGAKGLPGKVALSHTHLSREGLCRMLRDRAAPVDLFALVPALELRFEPELAELDRLLEDDQIFQQVKADLSRRRPHTTETGRPSTPVEVILRLLVVQHLYDWSYAQTEHFVGDSLVLRQFCRLGLEPVPHHTTLMRWANLLQPETMHRLLDRVTELARSLKVTRGRKLRIDSTVVATAIHYPTDSTLLFDGVRVLSRLVQHAATCAERQPATLGRASNSAGQTAGPPHRSHGRGSRLGCHASRTSDAVSTLTGRGAGQRAAGPAGAAVAGGLVGCDRAAAGVGAAAHRAAGAAGHRSGRAARAPRRNGARRRPSW